MSSYQYINKKASIKQYQSFTGASKSPQKQISNLLKINGSEKVKQVKQKGWKKFKSQKKSTLIAMGKKKRVLVIDVQKKHQPFKDTSAGLSSLGKCG